MPEDELRTDSKDVIAVWPCDHGNVHVEPGPAKPGYQCAVCGATASTYVDVRSYFDAVQERAALRSALFGAKHALYEIHGMLTPGMKAGVGQARGSAMEAASKIQKALDSDV